MHTPQLAVKPTRLDAAAILSKVGAYIALTKPRVIELLLVTTIPPMILAEGGMPSLGLVLAVLIGGYASAGASGVLNCYIDRDIDQIMHRTKRRPLVTGEVSPRGALIFGLALGVFSLVWFALLVNLLSALLTAIAIFIYVVVYTLILKRRTPQNIVWGGAAGCMPVLIGWAAVADSLAWPPVILFLVIFFWTPPHYWPLSMRFKEDYAAAHVPMLPVVAKDLAVARQVVLYSWATVLTSLVLVPVASMGWIYLVVAVLSGGVFLLEAHRLHARAKHGAGAKALGAMRLFHYSISYLTLLFLAVAIDPLLHLSL